MREILFRGKHVDNGEWVYGYYVPACFGRFPCRPAIVPEPNGTWRPIEVELETIGQYTGLTDKNGKKIFEGDILRICYDSPLFDGYDTECICYNGIVKYENGLFTCEENSKRGDALCALSSNEVEVIGNIHDNPELLEVKE